MRKNITIYFILAVIFIGCQTEDISTADETSIDLGTNVDDRLSSEIENLDFEEIQQSILDEVEGQLYDKIVEISKL